MAEFQKVMSEYRRLCEGRRCVSCPIMEEVEKAKENYCSAWVTNHPEEAEHIIMQWAKENPIKTNGMRFSEVLGFDLEALYSVSEATIKWLNEEYKGGQDERSD